MTDQQLRELAEKATPGPWRAWADGTMVETVRAEDMYGVMIAGNMPIGNPNAAYIAAASPDVMLAALDVIAAARKRATVRHAVPTEDERQGDGRDLIALAQALAAWDALGGDA